MELVLLSASFWSGVRFTVSVNGSETNLHQLTIEPMVLTVICKHEHFITRSTVATLAPR